MGYSERIIIYKKIEESRGKPLIVYATSIRNGASGNMNQDMIPHFIYHLEMISKDVKEIDLLILSNGGDPIVSWRVISLLRNRFSKITVLVPYTAFSAATLLALGADDIIMHRNGNLGPLDMQITVPPKVAGMAPQQFSFEDIMNYFKFMNDIGLKDQAIIASALIELTKEISPLTLGGAKRSSQLGLSMAEKMLSMHMKDLSKAKLISEKLNTQYYHHGYPVDRKEAKDIGLTITDNPEIEELMWEISQDILSDFKVSKPFDPNTIANEKIQKRTNIQIGQIYTDTEVVKYGIIENKDLVSSFEANIVLTYQRQKDLSLQINMQIANGCWETKENKQ